MNLENYLKQKEELKEVLGTEKFTVIERQLCSIFREKGIDTQSELLRKLANNIIQTCKILNLDVIDDQFALPKPNIERPNKVSIKSYDDCTSVYIDGIEIKKITRLNIDRNSGENSKVLIQFECNLDSETI